MTHIAIDHRGLPLPSPTPHDDGYEYGISGITQDGDEVLYEYGQRWLAALPGVFMANSLRYRRPKAMTKYTQDQYDAAMAFLKLMDFNSTNAIQLITLASSFGASLQSVNKEVTDDNP